MKTKTKAAGKKVADLTVAELTALIEDVVERKFEEMLGDPDAGLELTDECKESLRRSSASKEPLVSAEDAFARVGLEW